jgi:hypothetical protein
MTSRHNADRQVVSGRKLNSLRNVISGSGHNNEIGQVAGDEDSEVQQLIRSHKFGPVSKPFVSEICLANLLLTKSNFEKCISNGCIQPQNFSIQETNIC